MKIRAKHVALTVIVVIWLAAAGFSVRYLAGGIFMLAHKASPMQVSSSTWGEYWHDYQDEAKEKKILQGSMGFSIFMLFIFPLLMVLANQRSGRGLHGDARWAFRDEVEDAGLFADDGLILGKLGGKFLMLKAAKFVMLIAPTRSGKGVGTIIPNLLNWATSVIVVDIKGENYDVTSGFRAKHGQEVYKFAPFDEKFETHGFNPLSYVNHDPRFVVGDLQSIGYMLYPKKDGDGSFWNDQARNLFVGVALYCIESGILLSIGEVLRRSNGGGKPKDFWQGVVELETTPNGKPLSTDCLTAMRQFVGNSDNTLTSVLSTFNAPLGVFANPLVDAATSRSDFDLRDVRKRRMSIYVVIPPNKLDDAGLLVNLFFSLAIDQNTKTLPEHDPSLKHTVLLLLDEFPAMGRVDKYEKAIGYIAGYGIRVLTIAQSLGQLQKRELYGDEGTRNLVTNHLVQIVYAPREQKDAADYSEMLGYLTEKGVSTGTSRGAGPVNRSENQSDQKRALMMPQELREMGEERIIVLADNCKPIFGDKICYYKDPVFTSRVLAAHPVPAIDMDAYFARRDGVLSPVSVVKQDPLGTPPLVTNSDEPIPAEVTAMADWLFSSVKWTQAEGDLPLKNADVQESTELIEGEFA